MTVSAVVLIVLAIAAGFGAGLVLGYRKALEISERGHAVVTVTPVENAKPAREVVPHRGGHNP